jgi:hypothetical protein
MAGTFKDNLEGGGGDGGGEATQVSSLTHCAHRSGAITTRHAIFCIFSYLNTQAQLCLYQILKSQCPSTLTIEKSQ